MRGEKGPYLETLNKVIKILILIFFGFSVSQGALADNFCSWGGQWETSFGPLTLNENGPYVTGNYIHDNGTIRGTSSNLTLTGIWEENYLSGGDLLFKMTDNCTSFSGNWRNGYGGEKWDGYWNGTRAPIPPITNFTVNATKGVTPFTVLFTDRSSNSPTFWFWQFGDGGSSSLKNPIYTYNTAGIFSVNLTSANSAGKNLITKNSLITAINSVSPPVANFTANTRSGFQPLSVQFNDASLNVPSAWSWSFGDGTTSTLANPYHTYYSTGIFSVALTVSNRAGSSSITNPGYIIIYPAPTQTVTGTPTTTTITPTSTPTATTTHTLVPTTNIYETGILYVQSSPLGARIYIDGKLMGESPLTIPGVPTGSHNIRLEVPFFNIWQAQFIIEKGKITFISGVTLTPQGSPPPTIPPTYTPTSIPPTTSSTTTQIPPTTLIPTTQVPTFTPSPTYSPTLTPITSVTTITTNPTTFPTTFPTTTVTYPPSTLKAAFSASLVPNSPLSVQFTDQSTGNPVFWQWYFGDGKSSVLGNPVNQYRRPGTYSVSLGIKNSAGAYDKIVKKVIIYPGFVVI